MMRAAKASSSLILGGFGVALVLAAILAAGAIPGSGLPVGRAPDGRLRWGVYQIYWGARRFTAGLDATLSVLAGKPDFVMFYRDLGRPFPRDAITIIRQRGAVPIISLELWRWHQPSHKALPDIVEGKLDEYFVGWARDARADGGPVLLRFGFEFNGDWFNWGQDPESFVAAWRHAHDIFAAEGAGNVGWVWAANVVSVPDTPANDLHRYYPGDEYVDWVGLDGYNWGDAHDPWHHWQSFPDIFARPIDDLVRRHPGKPVMIAEFSSVEAEPGRKAQWIRDAHAWLAARKEVAAAVWFNYDKRREGEFDWRIDSSPEALTAFNATFAAP